MVDRTPRILSPSPCKQNSTRRQGGPFYSPPTQGHCRSVFPHNLCRIQYACLERKTSMGGLRRICFNYGGSIVVVVDKTGNACSAPPPTPFSTNTSTTTSATTAACVQHHGCYYGCTNSGNTHHHAGGGCTKEQQRRWCRREKNVVQRR